MIDREKIVIMISGHIAKNLRGNTPFQNTSEFISYIAFKENQKKI